jgi:hypothetical protein
MLAFKISDYRSQLEAEFALAEAVEEARLSVSRALRVEISNHAHNVPRDWSAERARRNLEIDTLRANLLHAIDAYFCEETSAVALKPVKPRQSTATIVGQSIVYALGAVSAITSVAFMAALVSALSKPPAKPDAAPTVPPVANPRKAESAAPTTQREPQASRKPTVVAPESGTEPESFKSAKPETIAQPETDVRPQEAVKSAQPETIAQRKRDARPGEFSQAELDALANAPVQEVSTSEPPKEPWKFPEYKQPEPIVAKTKTPPPVSQPETIAQPETIDTGVGPKPYGSCREAHSMGLGDIPTDHPWYRIDQDRDGDGFACDR